MTDYYLKAATEHDMDEALLAAGLMVERTGTAIIGYQYDGVMYDNYDDISHTEEVNEDGDVELVFPEGIETLSEEVTYLVPADGVSVDTIGPIVKWDYSVDPPVEIDYPEWHVNVRVMYDLTEEQLAAIEPVMIVPPEQPYRVFA